MNEPGARGQHSNEEILASIREVVSERAGTAGRADADDSTILDLTQEIRDDGSVVDIVTAAAARDTAGDEPPDAADDAAEAPEEGLVAADTESAASASFATIAEVAAGLGAPREPEGKTVEEMAREAMRPLIKEWLDANLPAIVERLVRREIERLSRRGESAAEG